MSQIAKRYLFTLVAGIAVVAVCGFVAVKLLGDPGEPSADSSQRGVIAGILIVGSFAVVGFFAAREKGRSPMYLLAGFIAPLLPIILLLPHTAQRRAELQGSAESSKY